LKFKKTIEECTSVQPRLNLVNKGKSYEVTDKSYELQEKYSICGLESKQDHSLSY